MSVYSYINLFINKIKPAHNNPSIQPIIFTKMTGTQGERCIQTDDIKISKNNTNKKNISESNMDSNNQELGSHGEEKVAAWLIQKGFNIKETNYRQRCGEIDIIATKDDILAFVEVKLRTNAYFNISEVITPSKQAKIIRTAMMYIMEHKITNKVYRFDVALLEKHADKYTLTYLPNAFTQKTY